VRRNVDSLTNKDTD